MVPMPGWRSREQLLDVLLGLVVTAITVAGALTEDPRVAYDFRDPNAVTIALALAAGLPLTVRRRWPLTVSVTVSLALFAIAALRWDPGQAPFCQMLALYAVAAWRDRWPALVALGVTYTCMGLLVILGVPYFDHPLAVVGFVAVTTAWVIGRIARRWRADRDAARERALAAERAGAVAAERAVFAERLHIARELHDVVSHTLTVIAVQSASARYLSGSADSPLSTIERASRAALDDLRRMLGVLRADTTVAGAADSAVEAVPAPAPVKEWVVDAAIAVALTALALTNAFVADPSVAYDYADPSVGLVTLVLVSCLALVARRRFPFGAFAVSAGATLALTLMDARTDVPGLAMFVALYTVASVCSFAVSTTCLGVVAGVDALLMFFGAPGTDPPADLAALGALVPWGLGLIVRRWRREREAAAERAREARRTAAVAAQRAVFAERLRIAAELHDVIAHTLSVIAVQSAVARHQLGDAPGPAGPALVAIEEASRIALDDLRRMLGVLDAEPRLDPNPGIDELGLLASAHRAAHGPVELTVDSAVRAAPASVQVTAYRLVQEALTNVRKHAPGAGVRVRVYPAEGELVVRVDDDGAAAASPGSGGFGLTGMRERVALFDGSLRAGPGERGGFQVEAVLRLDADRRVTT